MRWSVEVVLDLVGSGMTMDEIIAEHPELEREDIVACLPACTARAANTLGNLPNAELVAWLERYWEAIVESAVQERCYLEPSREGLIRLPPAC
jgi:hypothetical protein